MADSRIQYLLRLQSVQAPRSRREIVRHTR